MRFFRDASIRLKVLIPPAVLILALGLVSLLALYGMNEQHAALSAVDEIALERIPLIDEFVVLGERVQSDVFRIAVLGFMDLPGEEIEPIHERLEQGLNDLDIIYGQILTKWPLDETERSILERMKGPMDAFRQQALQAAAVVADDPSFGVLLVRSSAVPFAEFRDTLTEFHDYQHEEISRVEMEAIQKANTVSTAIIAGAFLIALAGVLATMLISTRWISRPILSITDLMGRLAEGELSIEVGGLERRDEIGAMARAVEVFRNNAIEKARLDQELRESEERFRRIYDSNMIGIAYWDPSGGVADANDAYLNMVGYARQDLEAGVVRWSEMTPPEYTHLDEWGMQEIREQGFCSPYEKEYIRKDGTRVPILLGGAFLEGEEQTGISYAIDITERKRAEEALRLHSEIMVNMAEGVYLVRASDGVIVYANPTFEEVFGYGPGEMVGKHVSVVNAPTEESPEETAEEIMGILDRTGVWRGEINNVKKDGTPFWCYANVSVFDHPQHGRVLVAVHTDITERKRAEETLKVSHLFLEIANRHTAMIPVLEEFVAEVKNFTGCAAVGMRLLDEAGNIPYEAYEGFSQRFYESESPLSIKSDQCMCINVVKGEADPELSFYTEGGSFFMNGTTRFLATVSEEEKGQTRNTCNQVGYESVALVPIRVGERILGLIHVADSRENMVPLKTVEVLEGVAMQLGTAIQRVRAEEALRVSEERFALAVRGSDAGLWDWDILNNSLYWSPRLKELLGYADDELDVDFDTFESLLHPDDREHMATAIEAHLKDRGLYDVEQRLRTKSGQYRWFRVRGQALWDEAGNPLRMVGSTTDITERKQTDETLRESEEKYRTILENIEDGYYEVDIAGNLTFFNDSLCRLYRYSEDELMGMNNRQYMDDRTAKVAYQTFNEVYRTGKPAEIFDWEVIRKDGIRRSVGVSISLMRDPTGEPAGFRGIVRDITERKRAEEERERLLAELEAKNRELESFVYTVSHDLKAPLVSLDGFSSELRKEFCDQLDEQGQHYLKRIQANVARMDALIMHLLELSRIGRVVGPVEEVVVAALLREIQEDLAVELEETGTELVVQEPLPVVRADRGRIRQVFTNLIDNAVKFRSEERPLRIEVGCQKKRGFYRFHVADNGIGIAPQYQEQIFEPFRQLDAKTEGVGMGLALAKKIVEHHGGRVWVESEAGKGTTFYFTVPVIGKQ